MRYLLLIFVFCLSTCIVKADTLTVTFRYESASAKSVMLAGTFNGWAAKDTLAYKDGNWTLAKPLPEGDYEYKLVVDGQWLTDPANDRKIADGFGGYNSMLQVGKPAPPTRKHRTEPLPKEKLPQPVCAAHPEWIDLYWAAWQMAWDKVAHGSKRSGLAAEYMDEGFSEQIYQWDSCFMMLFAIYGRDAFPVMVTLDNFYSRQRANGYIQRVYEERTGLEVTAATADEPMVNPPLFAWAELKYYQVTGDTSRIRRVLPVLIRYFDWLQKKLHAEGTDYLLYNTPLGSGMDNTPRPGIGKGAWIDFSSQQAFAALNIAKLAEAIGDSVHSAKFTSMHEKIAAEINKLCWNEKTGFYYDRQPDGTQSNVMHIGGFWPLIAGVATSQQAERLIEHLNDPQQFKTPHRVPTLSKSDSAYDPLGHYWLGSVWAPTNYMVLKGINNTLADSIAENDLAYMTMVMQAGVADTEKVPFEQRYGDGYHTIWECFSPEQAAPATRWDNTFYTRQDFVGWSGLTPIAAFIENTLGFTVNGAKNTIIWRIHSEDRHGIENLKLRNQHVSLIYEPSTKQVMVKAEAPFTLTLQQAGKSMKVEIPKGEKKIKLKIEN